MLILMHFKELWEIPLTSLQVFLPLVFDIRSEFVRFRIRINLWPKRCRKMRVALLINQLKWNLHPYNTLGEFMSNCSIQVLAIASQSKTEGIQSFQVIVWSLNTCRRNFSRPSAEPSRPQQPDPFLPPSQ